MAGPDFLAPTADFSPRVTRQLPPQFTWAYSSAIGTPGSTCRHASLGTYLFRALPNMFRANWRRFNQQALIDTTPLPDDIPKVKELGASSAPLLSAAFFIGARCKDYNDDYMMCKVEANGRGELDCMKEGRKVTRCAASVYGALISLSGSYTPANQYYSIKDLNEHCLEEFRSHWKCLDNQNHHLWNCRSEERRLNKCVFDKLVSHSSKVEFTRRLTRAEIGEDNTRYSQGRDACPSAVAEHLCV